MNKNKEHLSLFGVGPLYVSIISVATLTGLLLHYLGVLDFPVPPSFRIPVKIIAVALIVVGVVLWVNAALLSRLTESIRDNRLVTTGVYAYVRHPVYAAFMIFEWGLLLWPANVYLFLWIPFYWLFLTVLLKYTEEKWLLKLYGDEYRAYCKKVNRCIPF